MFLKIYSVALVSAIQQHKSTVIRHTSPPSLASPYPIPSGSHRAPDWAPCATQQLLPFSPATHLIPNTVYVLMLLSPFAPLSALPPNCVHKPILYICISFPSYKWWMDNYDVVHMYNEIDAAMKMNLSQFYWGGWT